MKIENQKIELGYYPRLFVLIFVIILFKDVVHANNEVNIPALPIYIYSTDESFELPNSIVGFRQVRNREDAFYLINVTHKNTYSGLPLKLYYSTIIFSTYFGFDYGNSLGLKVLEKSDFNSGWGMHASDPDWYNKGDYQTALNEYRIIGALAGAALGIYLNKIVGGRGKKFTSHYEIVINTPDGNILRSSKKKIVGRVYEKLSRYSRKELMKKGLEFGPGDFVNTLYEVKEIKTWIDFVNKVNSFQFDSFTTISTDNWKQKELSFLGKSRGEFETTLQYQDRLKKEKLTRRIILAEYQQKIQLLKDEYETKRIKSHREIDNLVNQIRIERAYEYSVSKYNADKQLFTFTIPAEHKSRDLIVPIDKAPRFKSKLGNLIVKQVMKPSLNSLSWEPVYDDVVLVDKSSGNIIPWEGEVSNYAAAPVTNPPSLSSIVELSEPSGDGYLDAEEIATLKVILKNDGLGPAKAIRISLSQSSGPTLYYDVSTNVESIEPGEIYTQRFQITVPENVINGKVAYTVSFLEAQGFEPEPVKFTAEVRAQREPILTLVDFGIVDQSGDGKVSKGESVEITARIQNRGQGLAKSIKASVLPDGNVFMHPDSKKEFELGNIPAGESRDVIFTILTNNRVADLISVELRLDEKRPQFSKNEMINLEIDKQKNRLEPLTFVGKESEVTIADLATLTVDIELNIPKGKKINQDGLAVIFGIEDYKNVSDVSFAKRDATYMKEYFINVLGIPSNRIYFRTDADVGQAEFSKVFSKDGWLDKRIKNDISNVFIYYAGHGAPDLKKNKAYLIPYDGDPNYASQTGYEINALYEQLSKFKAKSTTVFLDACFSGANRESEILLAGARPVFIEVESGSSGNVTVFSAAGGKEISSAWPEKKHGLFSYFLMKGMQGDADANKDQQITVGELGDYIKENVSEMAGMLDREQTPGLQTMEKNKVLIQYLQ